MAHFGTPPFRARETYEMNNHESHSGFEEELVLAFPWLHPELAGKNVPGEISFLSPAGEDPRNRKGPWPGHVPAHFPLEPADAAARVRDFIRLGHHLGQEQLTHFKARGMEDFYSETSMDIRSQLTGGVPEREPETEARLKAQLVLVLGHELEKNLLDYVSLDNEYASGLKRMGEILGSDAEEEDLETLGPSLATGTAGPEQSPDFLPSVPWRIVLEAMLVSVPSAAFYVQEPWILEEWKEMGLPLEPIAADRQPDWALGAGIEAGVLTAPGWRLLGLDREPSLVRLQVLRRVYFPTACLKPRGD